MKYPRGNQNLPVPCEIFLGQPVAILVFLHRKSMKSAKTKASSRIGGEKVNYE
jgi:hypothetical protein